MHANLLRQGNPIWFSNCNSNHHLTQFIVVHSHSRRPLHLLHRLNGKIKRRCSGIHYLYTFQVLDSALISAVSPGLWHCFWLTLLASKANSWLSFGLYHHNGLEAVGYRTTVRILPSKKYFSPNYTFRNSGNDYNMDPGSYWSQEELDLY